ncbi:MAG: hypothetical protein WC840_00770 [Candidatus Peribacteraceae bacterium]
MFVKKYIQEELLELKSMYDRATNPLEKDLICKLALIELCGWIEESVDEMVLTFVGKKTKDHATIKYVGDVLDRNHSFGYEWHFRHLLSLILGAVNFEKIEKKVERKIGTKAMATFKSSLGTLKTLRNDVAHTHVKGAARKPGNAPVLVLRWLDEVFIGLKAFRVQIRKK